MVSVAGSLVRRWRSEPSVDQNTKLVRYDVRFNRSEFEFVLENGYATTAKIGPSGPDSVLSTQLSLPDNRDAQFGHYGGSIELKGSWRELCTGANCTFRDDPTRYLTEPVDLRSRRQCRSLSPGPFENYVLIGTQWPFNGRVPGNEAEIYTRPCNTDALRPNLPGECYTIVPQFLRNTSMESFMASYFRPGQPLHQFSNRGA